MRGARNTRKTAPAERIAAVLFVVVHIAVLGCLANHHHASPHDNTPCLVCAGASPAAVHIEHAAGPPPPTGPAGQVLCLDEFADPFFLPGSAGIRAPPVS